MKSLVPDCTVALAGASVFSCSLEGIVGQDDLGELGMIRDGFDHLLDRSRDKLTVISPGSQFEILRRRLAERPQCLPSWRQNEECRPE